LTVAHPHAPVASTATQQPAAKRLRTLETVTNTHNESVGRGYTPVTRNQ
jgi:hypothetical protein